MALLPEHTSALFSSLSVKLNDTVVVQSTNFHLAEMFKLRLLTSAAEQFLMEQTQGLDFSPAGEADTVDGAKLAKRKLQTNDACSYEVLLPIKLEFLNGKCLPFGTRIFVQLEHQKVHFIQYSFPLRYVSG